jgi:LuxR family maltose regulon positive regulatory protein
MTILRAELAVTEAIAHRELGDRARAMAELEALAVAPAETMVYCQLLALLELVRAHLDAGELAVAREWFGAAESLVVTASIGSGGSDWLRRAGAELARAAGDPSQAWRWSEQVEDPYWRAILAARLHLDAGSAGAAREAAAGVEPRCPRHAVILDLVRARATEDPDEAAKLVASAVEVAASHELLQSVVDDGRQITDLLEREAGRVPAPWMDRLRRLVAVTDGPRSAPLALIEPLTEREREVLRFLPSRLTTREIADELYVSVNTLKFHLKVIYRKLGVTSRAEAVERARKLSSR